MEQEESYRRSAMEEKLLKLIRERPVLFDRKHRHFRNSVQRNHAWDDIAMHMGMQAQKCRYHWMRLRNAYTQVCVRRRRREEQNGVTTHTAYRYEKQMAFLLGRKPHTRGEENSEEDAGDELGFSVMSTSHIEAPVELTDESLAEQTQLEYSRLGNNVEESQLSMSTEEPIEGPRWPKAVADEPISQQIAQLADLVERNQALRSQISSKLSQYSQPAHDDIDLFFLSMARFAKKLPVEEQVRIKAEVSKMIFQAESNALKQAPEILTPVQQKNSPASFKGKLTPIEVDYHDYIYHDG